MKYFLAILFIISTITSAQNFKKIQIEVNELSALKSIAELGIDLESAKISKDGKIEIFVAEDEYNSIKQLGYSVTVLIDDWFKYYDSLPKLSKEERNFSLQKTKDRFNVTSFDYGSMGGYLTNQEVEDALDDMFSAYPNLITEKYSVGTTIEGRDIFVAKISDNPDVDEDEPEVFFNSLIHAREPAAMMAVIYYMWYLLENYGTDPEATYLVDNREIFFLPVFNVDGYVYNETTNPNGGGMWRKNRKNNGNGSYGIDLNRNWGYMWGYDNSGSSPNPSDPTYRGTGPFSEPETEAVRQFCNSRGFLTALNYHTYSNLLIQPWCYITQPTPDADIFDEFASEMTEFNGYTWGLGGDIIYNVNGGADDWMYGEQIQKGKIIAMTPEVGDSFWPSQSLIIPLAEENLYPNLYITWAAGDFVKLQTVDYNVPYFQPGDDVEMTINVRNKGLGDAENISINIATTNLNITINNNSVDFGNIPARTTSSNIVPHIFEISNSAPVGQIVEFVIGIYSNGQLIKTELEYITIGVPTTVFEDNTDDPTINWTITSTPTYPKWDATFQEFYSSPSSFTDSKNGEYSNDATVTMTLTNEIDLSGLILPRLSFWTKWDIEGGWDYGQVEISTNGGSTWIPLEGSYTTLGSGSFQPTGEPLYDGYQADWVQEEMNLENYIGQQIKIRFQLVTDVGVTEDGWYVDDIIVYSYQATPVELNSFTSTIIDNELYLNWSTATETNNKGFQVEIFNSVSDGNNKSWQKIGFVEGKGTTDETSEYSFKVPDQYFGKSEYRLVQIDFDGTINILKTIEVDFQPVYSYSLKQNYPNPFNPYTKLSFSIALDGFVKLSIYNVLGEHIDDLVNQQLKAGKYEFIWSSANQPSGIYFYKITANDFLAVKKMNLIK